MDFSRVTHARVDRRSRLSKDNEPWFKKTGKVVGIEETEGGLMVSLEFEDGEVVIFERAELVPVSDPEVRR